MHDNQKGGRRKAKAASAWAMGALLTLQLAGTALPTALAQEMGNNPNPDGPLAEVIEKSGTDVPDAPPQTAAPVGTTANSGEIPAQPEESTTSQTGEGENAAAGEGEPAVLMVQNSQDAITYVNENGGEVTRTEYTLVAVPEGEDPLILSNGWYVAKGEVNISTRIEVQGDAHLILCDGARLDAQKGVHNAEESTLSVYGQAGHTGELYAAGDVYQHNAGIGGNEGEKAGTFNAYGARTVVQGGSSAAGIGGGYKNDGGTVLIRGEKTVVTASGGGYGAGIGGGDSGGWDNNPGTGYTGTVTIEGGTVTANGGSCGAGIGGGSGYGADSGGGTVTIKGGTVNATGGENGAGIGGANGLINGNVGHTKGADVRIEGGTVTATGRQRSPGIGTGSFNASEGSLTVTGGDVTATGGTMGAGIGGGYVNRDHGEEDGDFPVTITGGTVTAKAGNLGAGIGGGDNGDGVTVKIGGTAYVVATGGEGGAGIGSGDGGRDPGSFEASSGTVIATAGPNAAGIGTGKTANGIYDKEPKITITGGNITAHGDKSGAGIGGGEFASGGTIKITGGTVRADGSDRHPPASGPNAGGAGIGAGGGDSLGKILTNGGKIIIGGTANVEATGGKWCAGIGGGRYGDGAEVTISGNPVVTATGGEGGAGIGGGRRDSGGLGGAGRKVTIDGGTVTAKAGSPNGGQAEAIGHGSGWDVSGDLAVYDAARVLHGSDAEDATISTAAQRIEKCRELWAQISLCDHRDTNDTSTETFKPTANRLRHIKGCTQCLYIPSDQSGSPIEYDHKFDAGGECACGVHAHRVLFDKNADRATGTMPASDYVVERTPYTLPTCGFVRNGYAVAGWNTQAQGGGEAYADQATLTMGEANVTLFAQWRPTRFGEITGVAASYMYNGRPHEPKPSVKGLEGQPLREGTDYRLEYANNVNATTGPGKAMVRVVGVGEYAGVTATIEFAIAKSTPAPPQVPRRKSATATSVSVYGDSGCEYSIDGGKTWRALGADGTVTFPGLRPGTAYNVVGRVCATANTNASAASAALSISTESPRASASYRAHVKNLGWRGASRDGAVSGTTGRALRMEALSLGVAANMGGGVSYRAHVANRGWLGWARDGATAGTTGQSRRMEAVQIRLDGELSRCYSVYYRVHVRHLGWMAWTCDGRPAGTVNESRRIEAIQVVLVKKGDKAPATDYKGAVQAFPQPFRKNGLRAN